MPDPTSTSRLLTLVFTDLANSTALKTQRGDSAVGELIRRHRELVTRLAGECSGRIIDWAGDGCFLTFEVSSAGVLFALRLQQAHADQPDLPQVRVGIHLGEVTERTGLSGEVRAEGLAVDMAARIGGLARPGQVLMSSAVYHSARQRLGVETLGKPVLWQTHGAYTFKGFDEPLDISEAALEGVAKPLAPDAGDKARPAKRSRRGERGERWTPLRITILVIVVVTIIASRFPESGPPKQEPPAAGPSDADVNAPIKSLAVLPLENLSKDPEQEYFSDGMTEALTSELSKIKSVKVISRTSVMKYKGTKLSMPEIAAELGVEGLIEGSVQKYGDEIRITAQLIHGPSDTHRWAQSYTNTITNVLKLQSEVALAIADAMKAELTGDERSHIATIRTIDPKAHDAYLLGIHFQEDVTAKGIQTSIRYLEEATQLDPKFAQAWARLGRSYRIAAAFAFLRPDDAYPKAREACLRALELDGDLPEAHDGLAQVAWRLDRQWQQAEDRYKHVFELDSRYATGHITYGFYLLAMGRRGEAADHAEAALELDPDSVWTRQSAGFILNKVGRTERAFEILDALVAERPDFLPGLTLLGEVYIEMGECDKALPLYERAAELSNREGNRLVYFASALAHCGQIDRARSLIREVASSGAYFDASFAAVAYARMGDLDSAFTWMSKSAESKDMGPVHLRTTPYMKANINDPNIIRFRTDPRFFEILDRMKLPPLPPDHPGYAEEQAWLAQKKAAADANAPISKIAVLPFKNISGDATQEYFVDGMTEALISELAKIKSIKVISRTSAMHYKDTKQTLPEIAKELGVEGIVEGSAMKAGNDVRITAQLIRAATDEHVWAESFTNTMENVLQLQGDVALKIAGGINAIVTPQETARIASAKPVNPAAYAYYLQGRALWNQRETEDIEAARALFERAIELDPSFALAHVGLADALSIQSQMFLKRVREQAVTRGREEALKALEIDPQSGEAYATLGMWHGSFDWNWKEAEKAHLKSIELSPSYATGRQWYGLFLLRQGRTEEALTELEKAYELDPVSPIIAAWLARAMSIQGRSHEALEVAEGSLKMYTGNAQVRMAILQIYTRMGRYDDALQLSEEIPEAGFYNKALQQATLLAIKGQGEEARKTLATVLEDPAIADANPTRVAIVYAALNERDKAFEWLDRAFDGGDFILTHVKIHEPLRTLRDDPRYKDLLRRMGLPE